MTNRLAAPFHHPVLRTLWRNSWVLGVWLLLFGLLIWYSTLIPVFGPFQIASITKNSLPLVYLAIGQAIIVVAGGIDLSLGALPLLSNVVAARFMEGQPAGVVAAIGLALVAGMALLNAFTGLLIHRSGVPDIVVTLATSYIWSGLALWILPSPGGGTAPEMRWLFTGSPSGIGGSYWPPLLMILVPGLLVALWARNTRPGLTLYAAGSNRIAAQLAGLDVRRAKILAYALGGSMAAAAGLATVAITGTGDPRFAVGASATLNSVAAVVLGGIALTGGVGNLFSVVATGVTLIMLNPILIAMGVNSNNAQVIQGAPDRRGDDGWRFEHLPAGATIMRTPTAQKQKKSARQAQNWLAENPLVALFVVFLALFLLTGAVQPNFLSINGVRNTLLQAAPLGILAAAQTALMLTGGIDLSVAMIATGAAYVAANQSPNGAGVALLAGTLVGLLIGSVNGVGVALFRVNPLIMTLAMSGILLGLFTAWTQTVLAGSTQMAPFIKLLGGGAWMGSVPYSVLVWGGVTLLVFWLFRRSGWGRLLYAIGDNERAVRLAGVRVWQVRLSAYMLSGMLAAIAGMLLGGRTGAVDLQLAGAFLLPSVAAAVIGGTSIFGGVGGYTGTILGALILSVLNSLLTFLNVGQAIQQMVYGSIVLALAWGYASLMRRSGS